MSPRLLQLLLHVFGLSFAVFLGFLVPSNPSLALLMAGGTLSLMTVQHHGKIAITLIVTTISSAFILPHSSRPYIWEVSSIFAFSGVLSALAFQAWPPYSKVFLRRNALIVFFTIFYGLFLIVLMQHHGAGLRILGSESMGARFYLQQTILIPLPLCAILYPPSRSLATKLIIIQLIFAFTYIVSEAFFRFQLPGASIVLSFTELQSDTLNFTHQALKGGIDRYQSIGVFAYNIAILLLVVYPIRRVFTFRGLWMIPVFALLVLLSGIGGSRRLTVNFMVISLFIFWIQRALDFRRIFTVFIVFALALTILYQNTERLPLSIQRSVSFLPGIEVDAIAKADADITMALRRDLRIEAVRIIRKNFWTGVGFDVDPNLRRIRNPTIGAFEIHALNGRFYSGPIGIFATLGVGHFVMFLMIQIGMISLAVRIIRILRKTKNYGLFERISALIVARFLSAFFLYTFITGDAFNALKTFVPHAVMMIICERILVLNPKECTEGSELDPHSLPAQ